MKMIRFQRLVVSVLCLQSICLAAAASYQGDINSLVEHSSIQEVLGSKQVIASSWYPVSFWHDNAAKAREEALANIATFLGSSSKPSILEEVLKPEQEEVCTHYTKVKTQEQNGDFSSNSSSSSHFEFTLASVAGAFGLVGALAALGPAGIGIGALATLGGIAGMYNNLDFRNDSSSAHDEVGYYMVKEDLKCDETDTYIRYTAELTPDVLKLDPQILANLIQQNRDKARDQVLSSVDVLTQTTEELIRNPIRVDHARDAVALGELTSFLSGWPYADLFSENTYLSAPRALNILSQFPSDYRKALTQLKASVARYRKIYSGDASSISEVNRRFSTLLSILNALESKTLRAAFNGQNIVVLEPMDISLVSQDESFDAGFPSEPNSQLVISHLNSWTEIPSTDGIQAKFDACVSDARKAYYGSDEDSMLGSCIDTFPTISGTACQQAANYAYYGSDRDSMLAVCAGREK